MKNNNNNHIKVYCRIRPNSLDELESPVVSILQQKEENESEESEEHSSEILVNNNNNNNNKSPLTFRVDQAFDGRHSQQQIFDYVLRPMIDNVFKGFHCSLFSYGQTGSGKTYTLLGN
jgi:DNA replication protein DnaC